MPLIDLYYPAGTFTPEARTELADGLTTVLLRAERAPDTEFFRKITWIHVHEQPVGTMLAAGAPVEDPVFRVQVTVPQGALSERRKAELVSEATAVVREAAGLGDHDGLRVWVLINEVPDGNWGAGGRVVRFERLRQYAEQERERPGSAVVEPAVVEPAGAGTPASAVVEPPVVEPAGAGTPASAVVAPAGNRA